MKIKFYLSFLITFISFNVNSQIIEEKKEGDFTLKNYLNNDLEIIKVEKYKDNYLYESIEYLPGGKIKNGKFFNKIYGFGNYVNGRLESGEILYIKIISNYSTESSWYIDNKNQIYASKNKIYKTYTNNNMPLMVYENENNQRIPFKNYDESKIVTNLSKCHYAKLQISNFRLKGMYQIKVGYFSDKTKILYEKNDGSDDLVSVLNFNENGVLDGEQLYFKTVHYGLTSNSERDDRKIVHSAMFKSGKPLKYWKIMLPNRNSGTQIFIDSITFQKDELKNSTFLYDNTIVNHPQPTLVFNPFSDFVQLTNHYYYKNDIIGNSDQTNPDNANLKSLVHTRQTNITNDLKKIIFKRSIDENELVKDNLFFDNLSGKSYDTEPDASSNERKITFNGKPKIFYIKETNFIDRIIKNDYSFFPYAFNWQEPGIKNSNEIPSIELLYWYEFMLKGSAIMDKTYFSKEIGLNERAAEFSMYGNHSRYESVSYLQKDIKESIIYEETEYSKLNEQNKNDNVDLSIANQALVTKTNNNFFEKQVVEGDFNFDNIKDVLKVYQDTINPKALYKIEISLSKKDNLDKYEIISTLKVIKPDFPDAENIEDRFFSGERFDRVEFKDGIITFKCDYQRGYYTHKYKFQNNSFELINVKRVIGSADYLEDLEYNLITGELKKKIEEGNKKPIISIENHKISPLPKLGDFVPFESEFY